MSSPAIFYPENATPPAVGDGSADDTSALTNIISQCEGHLPNGGVLFLTQTYKISSRLTVSSPMSIIGFGAASIKPVNNTFEPLLIEVGASGCLLSGFSINVISPDTIGPGGPLMQFVGLHAKANGCILRDIALSGNYYGVFLDGAGGAVLENCSHATAGLSVAHAPPAGTRYSFKAVNAADAHFFRCRQNNPSAGSGDPSYRNVDAFVQGHDFASYVVEACGAVGAYRMLYLTDGGQGVAHAPNLTHILRCTADHPVYGLFVDNANALTCDDFEVISSMLRAVTIASAASMTAGFSNLKIGSSGGGGVSVTAPGIFTFSGGSLTSLTGGDGFLINAPAATPQSIVAITGMSFSDMGGNYCVNVASSNVAAVQVAANSFGKSLGGIRHDAGAPVNDVANYSIGPFGP
jgi:hypothetical protein